MAETWGPPIGARLCALSRAWKWSGFPLAAVPMSWMGPGKIRPNEGRPLPLILHVYLLLKGQKGRPNSILIL